MSEPKFSTVEPYTDKASIALITKRTYRIHNGERAQLAEEQIPLNMETIRSESGLLVHENDAFNYKPATDVVIKGSAHAPSGVPVKELNVAAGIGNRVIKLQVFGDRSCQWQDGRISFSEPKPFISMPLDYLHAYGGSDEEARTELDNKNHEELQKFFSKDLSRANLCVYKRNALGKGYLIHADEHAEGLQLPNIEDPEDLLKPERLAVEDAEKWFYQPSPVCFDWKDIDDFPRSAFMGMTCDQFPWSLPKPGEKPVREELQGYFPTGFIKPNPIKESFNDRVLNGASVGLVFPFMKGNEKISLLHMDPNHPEFTFWLPAETPRFSIRPLDEKTVHPKPKLYSIIVEKEKNLVSLVWGADVKTTYFYGPDQTGRVPFTIKW